MKRAAFAFAIMTAVVSIAAFAGEKKPKYEPPQAVLNFVVVKDFNGKPVRNAAVVMHAVNGHGKQERGGLELKTDADGKASFDGMPYGKLRVQTLAPGFQTFGEDYDIEQPTVEITIRLKRPEKQYSIYEEHPDEKQDAPPQPK